MPQLAQKPRRTHCPNCGARLPEQPLSLCSYCAMPLDLDSPAAERQASPNAERIARIQEQEAYPAALEWEPPAGSKHQHGVRLAMRGRGLLYVAGIALVLSFVWNWGWPGALGWTLAGLSAAAGTALLVRAHGLRRAATGLPLLRRAAVILDRRSDTQLQGWRGSTCYFFTLEFEGGATAEFAYPGRGYAEDLYPSGLTGVAYTRGRELLQFKHIRI